MLRIRLAKQSSPEEYFSENFYSLPRYCQRFLPYRFLVMSIPQLFIACIKMNTECQNAIASLKFSGINRVSIRRSFNLKTYYFIELC